MGISATFKRVGLALAVLAAPASWPAAAQDNLFVTVATVGDAVITGYDLEQLVRIKALERGSEDRAALEEEALNELVDARIIAEEGQRLGVASPAAEIDIRIAQLAAATGANVEDWLARLAERGIDQGAVRYSVETQLLWQQLLNLRFGAQVREELDEEDIERELRQVEREQYVAHHLFAIELPADSEERRQRAFTLASDIRQRLSEGANFADIARRISRGSNAEVGGEIGWRRSQDLPPDLQRVVDILPVGAVSDPLPVAGTSDALLLHVAARRVVAAEGIEPWQFTLTQYTLPAAAEDDTVSESEARELMESLRESDSLCGDEDPDDSRIHRDRIEGITVIDLPLALRTILFETEIGEATPVQTEPRGSWFVVVCERFGGIPDRLEESFRQRVTAYLIGTRLDQLGETYLAQLRSRAVVRRMDP